MWPATDVGTDEVTMVAGRLTVAAEKRKRKRRSQEVQQRALQLLKLISGVEAIKTSFFPPELFSSSGPMGFKIKFTFVVSVFSIY